MNKHYCENRNPVWLDNCEKWEFTWDQYTGKYIDIGKITKYLHRKLQREGAKAYESRQKDPDPIMHFATAVDTINGLIKDYTRQWGELGDPEIEGTISHSLMRDADGNGTNWDPFFKRVGIKLTALNTVWGLVDGVMKDEKGKVTNNASIKIINPQAVVDFYPQSGTPQQVLVKEHRDVRTSIEQEPMMQDVYTLFTVDGWKRFIVTDGTETVLDFGEYEYYESSRRDVRVLPIFKVELPLPRMIGYLLAKKQNHIFNFKSLRDHGASNLSLSILKIKCKSEQFESITSDLEKGSNILREEPDVSGSGHSFMSPDGSFLSESGRILESDVKDFYHNAFKEYGDVAKQATATEIRQKSATGIEAFLSLLVASVDEFENQCFLRLLQVYFPDKPDVWGSAYVHRDDTFQPEDIESAVERMKKRFFGDDPVPVPSKIRAELAKQLLEREGIDVSEEHEAEFDIFVTNYLNQKLAETVSKLVGYGMSTEQAVRTLHPDWEDPRINAEIGRIQKEKGLQPVAPELIE